MNWDGISIYLCVRLIKATLENEKITNWDIAKEYFKEEEKIKKVYQGSGTRYLIAKTNLITHRLRVMEKNGIVRICPNDGKKCYLIDAERVIIKKSKFVDNKLREFLCVKDNSNKWDIFEL